MDGTELLNEISRRIKKQRGTKTITEAALARAIGVAQPSLAQWRGKQLTPLKVVNIMEKKYKQLGKLPGPLGKGNFPPGFCKR